jgi:hypothetical protein
LIEGSLRATTDPYTRSPLVITARRSILVGLALVVASACGGDASSPAVGGETSDGSGSTSSEPTAVFSSGSETVAIGGDLPDGFPTEFPLPDGVEVAFSGSSGGSYAIWFSGGQSFDELKSYFENELPANGWNVDSSLGGATEGAEYHVFVVTGNGYSGGVMIGTGAPGAEGFEEEFAFFVTLAPA